MSIEIKLFNFRYLIKKNIKTVETPSTSTTTRLKTRTETDTERDIVGTISTNMQGIYKLYKLLGTDDSESSTEPENGENFAGPPKKIQKVENS